MTRVHLRDYNNASFDCGRSKAWQVAWFLIGLPILRSAIVPFSGVRVYLLRLFGATIGHGVVIKPGFRVKYPWNLKVGDYVWLGEDCWIDNLTTVSIGNDVCISQGAYLCTGNHNWSDPAFGLSVGPIAIGDGCWVSAKAFLLPGVVLEEGAIAAGGSVVTRSIPSNEVHAGNPARFLRHRNIKEAKARLCGQLVAQAPK